MKKYFLSVALLAIASLSLSAQSKAKEWSSFYVQYNPMTFVQDISGYDDLDFKGFTVGYDKAISIGGVTPVFLNVGGAVNAAFYSESEGDEEERMTFVAAKVPVSLTYKWAISDAISILPYAGLYARFNIIGNLTQDNGYDDETISVFDKKDMGSSDATWKRFQIGYQIGANVMFNDKWHLGLAWSSDFSEICKKCKFNTPAITIGLEF